MQKSSYSLACLPVIYLRTETQFQLHGINVNRRTPVILYTKIQVNTFCVK